MEPEEPEVVTVRDGSVLFVRRVHPSDKPHFERGFARLSRESKYFRFLADRKELTEADLEYLTEVDGDNHYAVVAFVVDPAGEIEGIGVARYVRLPDRPEAAEVAVTVADAWQRRGIGTMLYDRLLAAARERGIKILQSDIHFENRGIRELLEKAAPATVIERDGVVVTLELRI